MTVVTPDIDPSNTTPAGLIGRLVSLKHQAVGQSWIGGRDFIEDLDEKLDQAKRDLGNGDGSRARHPLREFIRQLDEQHREEEEKRREEHEEREGREGRGDHHKDRERHSRREKFLNDSAFFLLKVNAEYILSKLPKPHDEDDHEREEKRPH